MAQNDTRSGIGFPAILNSVLLASTIIGGILLASNKLTSGRPTPQVVPYQSAIGNQQLDARLWEDPFKAKDAGLSSSQEKDFTSLSNQIVRRTENANKLTILPVFIAGGPYSEDRESRIRSRFAVVSALGRCNYVPEDAEHIGAATLAWPNTTELEEWRRDTNAAMAFVIQSTNTNATSKEKRTIPASLQMMLRYEWYRPRTFQPASSPTAKPAVLVLWLDDNFFEDAPLLRLPLLLKPLIEAVPAALRPNLVQLLGPRRSATLRQMLPDQFTDAPISSRNLHLASLAKTQALNWITLHSATVSAMDAAFVETPAPQSREAIRTALKANGFADALFYNATDAELAVNLLEELKLRRADMSASTNHLVLLSEWDTFYGRMLSLTYSATVAMLQTNQQQPSGFTQPTNIGQFVAEYRQAGRPYPSNFHSFVYLRGLDGKTASGGADDFRGDLTSRNEQKPKSFEDLVNWKPEANRAEGPPQFDYLSRTGDLLEDLEGDLRRRKQGTIKAVGIVGSDVYDVLLILQALRQRFPAVLFFTTDLDARYLHPNERAWTRNLIVSSSYGLQLHPDFQGGISPFRDSSQTAQFAATLAALNLGTKTTNLASMSPRRFEIGRSVAVDLSVPNLNTNQSSDVRIHPLTLSEQMLAAPDQLKTTQARTRWLCIFLALLILYFVWNPFRPRSLRDYGLFSHYFVFTEADLGDHRGAEILLERLNENNDPLCREIFSRTQCILFAPNQHDPDGHQGPPHVTPDQKTQALLDALNRIVNHEELLHTLQYHPTASGLVYPELASKANPTQPAQPWYHPYRRFQQRRQTRKMLDDFLHRLSVAPPPELKVAQDARLAAAKLFVIRGTYLGGCILLGLLAVGISCVLYHTIVKDTFETPTGEPFSLTSGTSAWPNLILRLISIFTATVFIALLFQQLRAMFYNLSREYRLTFSDIAAPSPAGRICASQLWRELRTTGRIRWRLVRAGIPFGLYFGFGLQIILLTGAPFAPLRGTATSLWDKLTLYPFVMTFLLLCFLTIDAALRCRSFIAKLSAAPTDYPQTTRAHFQSKRGDVSPEYLDEWIDTQLIADLTERVGSLLWLPAISFLLMLSARNSYTDHWPLSYGLLVLFGLNFCLATASVVIQQHVAHKAKKVAEASLASKIKRLREATHRTREDNDVDQAEKLLDEIKNIRRGAFARLWENPVFGAILLPSGGTALIQIIAWASNR
ncbi:MAG: hypothetical protein QM813_10515 [Verrucomicrobiota bacterium]